MDSPVVPANSGDAPDSNGPVSEAASSTARLVELAALVDAVKNRVRAQYPESTSGTGVIAVGLPDLAPLARARDAAAAKMAAIGSVNPRRGGPVNNSIQSVKRLVARALNWFVRDQVVFNRQMVTIVEICIETFAEVNRTIYNLSNQANTQVQQVRTEAEQLRAEARILRAKTSELQDLASHWHRWREEWQLKLHRNEVEFLRSVADLNTAFLQKIMHVEAATQQRVTELHVGFERHAEELRKVCERRVDSLESAGVQELRDAREAYGRSAALLETTYEQQFAALRTGYEQEAVRLRATFESTAGQLDARWRQADASFRETALQLEKSFRETLVQSEASFELLANSNAENIQRSTISQVEALAEENRRAATAMDQRLVQQVEDFQGLLAASITEVQKKFHADLDRIRAEYERVIHAELRIVRQRLLSGVPEPAAVKPPEESAALPFDYARFADRFRGSEEYVTESQRFYLPYFAGRRNVLDVGCGRGEFLKLMQQAGIPAKGIEASEESAAYCRSLGCEAVRADLFTYLSAQPEGSLDGIFCSQVVEHLAAARLPELVRLCASRLATGGILVIETPNPECLAIFGTHFYLDPTHTRPVPSQLLAFYMEEFGLGRIEVHRRAPAFETMPEVGELPAEFREKFFGGLDYAIIASKL
jgi:2-polyprenyl-3-methyl-5-hydroxy-6-metoxy-1,4-benzoquinol methylase